MSAFLSADWVATASDPAAAALGAAGETLQLVRIVTGGPDGEVRLAVALDEGRSVRVGPPGPDDPEPELTLTNTAADLAAMLRGELDPNAAFMQGRTKVAGSTAKLLALLAATKTDAYEHARAELAAATEF